MSHEEYWQAILCHQLGTLPPEQERQFHLAGIFAECGARFNGTTLLPQEWYKPDVEPQDMPCEVMVALGINALRMSAQGREAA
jgi:hypothetical protein